MCSRMVFPPSVVGVGVEGDRGVQGGGFWVWVPSMVAKPSSSFGRAQGSEAPPGAPADGRNQGQLLGFRLPAVGPTRSWQEKQKYWDVKFMLREHHFAAQAHPSACQRVITLGMLLIKEPELSPGARTCREPGPHPGLCLSPPCKNEGEWDFLHSFICLSVSR